MKLSDRIQMKINRLTRELDEVKAKLEIAKSNEKKAEAKEIDLKNKRIAKAKAEKSKKE